MSVRSHKHVDISALVFDLIYPFQPKSLIKINEQQLIIRCFTKIYIIKYDMLKNVLLISKYKWHDHDDIRTSLVLQVLLFGIKWKKPKGKFARQKGKIIWIRNLPLHALHKFLCRDNSFVTVKENCDMYSTKWKQHCITNYMCAFLD